jgi:hypothetical protein
MPRKRKIFDIGQRFGSGVVISCLGVRPDDSSRSRWWLLQCDCGNKYERRTSQLNYGDSKSCGCYHKATGKNSAGWRGCGDIPLTFFNCLKYRSRSNVKEVSITIEDLQEQWKKQDGKCIYTGINLTFGRILTKPNHPNHKEKTASLDRIDSSKGYVLGNIEFCHKHINAMKQSFEKEHFIKMCKLVAGVK